MNPRKSLRQLIAGKRYVVVPGAYDTLTARLVQVAGFEAVYLTGGGYSRSNGYPDIGLLTQSEVTQWISRTVDAVDIPVIADMDAGYGNALNVIRSVREYEKTGVAAFHLEDQVSPKKPLAPKPPKITITPRFESKVAPAPKRAVGPVTRFSCHDVPSNS